MIKKDTESQLFKFDLSILAEICKRQPKLFVPVFLRLMGNPWSDDKIEMLVYKYISAVKLAKSTNRNYLLDKDNTLKFLNRDKAYALQYIMLAAHRSLYDFRKTGDSGLPIIEYPELDTRSHNPLLYHENGKVMFVPEKYKFDNKTSKLI